VVASRTTSDLLTAVRLRAQLPDADGRLSSTEILDLAEEALNTTMADMLLSTRTQRWTSLASDVAIASGTYLYAVPPRALAAGVTDVLITDGTTEWSAPEISVADAYLYRQSGGDWDSPFAYCYRDDQVELLPHPTGSTQQYYLRVLYPRTPPKLVLTTACNIVASKTATTITTTSTVVFASTATLDIVPATTNSHEPRGFDLAGSSIATTNITILAGVPSTTVAGDYVVTAGTTPIPPIPTSLWYPLVRETALLVVASLGDVDHAQLTASVTDRVSKAARSVLEPRSRGATPKIIARQSPLRIRRGWR
jgi:hypothetical protein